jgi:hypothetical protein
VVQVVAPPERYVCCTGSLVLSGRNTFWYASYCTSPAFRTPQPEAFNACALFTSNRHDVAVGKTPVRDGTVDVL